MILVNNPGAWGGRYQYAPLRHADWHGCTFTDLVFPTFLFCVGVAIVPALQKKLQRGAERRAIAVGVGKRVLSLVLLGLFLSAFPLITFAAEKPLFDPLLTVRFPGVLQRIGVCYGIAALLFLFTSSRTQRFVLLLCLLTYWPVLACCPTPDGGAPDLDSKSDHLAGWPEASALLERLGQNPHAQAIARQREAGRPAFVESVKRRLAAAAALAQGG